MGENSKNFWHLNHELLCHFLLMSPSWTWLHFRWVWRTGSSLLPALSQGLWYLLGGSDSQNFSPLPGHHTMIKGSIQQGIEINCASVQFSHSVMSYSLWPHELQRVRPHCPSPTPGVYSNSSSSSWCCHSAISSSIVPFSSCPQSLPASLYNYM